MKIMLKCENYIKKYIDQAWPINTNTRVIERSDVISLLAISSIKLKWCVTQQKKTNTVQLNSTINFTASTSRIYEARIKKALHRDHQIGMQDLRFNQSVRKLFYRDFYRYCQIRIESDTSAKKQPIIVKIIDDWMAIFDLSDDDIKSATLLKNFQRHYKTYEFKISNERI